MHCPPAATRDVRRLPSQGRLPLTLGLLGVGLNLCFVLLQPGLVSALCLAVALAALGVAALAWRTGATGRLHWDGEHWYWSDGQIHRVDRLQCILDMQRRMLVRIGCEHRVHCWLWLESPAMDERWRALRRAVAHSQGAQGAPAAHSLPQ